VANLGSLERLNQQRKREIDMELEKQEFFQTQVRGSNDQEYQLYRDLADDGNGGDITRGGKPLKTYDEWLNS
jgi:hypothetical protein